MRGDLSLVKKAAYALITAALVCAGAEAVVRVATREVDAAERAPVQFLGANFTEEVPVERDADRFWRMKPGAEIRKLHERIGDDGCRGPLRTGSKGAGVRRVLVLGDSCAYGIAVLERDTFARRLERWLSASESARWEVVNAGVPGYSAFQMLRTLDAMAESAAPDVVVVYAGAWNDYAPAVGASDVELHRRAAAADAWPGSWLGRLELYQCLLAAAGSAAPRRVSDLEQRRAAWAERQERPDGPRLAPDDFRSVMLQIAARARAAGAEPIFIIPPLPEPTRARFADGGRYAEIARAAAAEAHAPCADERDDFARAHDDDALFADFVHPSYLGHGRIAAAVAEAMQRAKIAGTPEISADGLRAAPASLKKLQPTARHRVGAAEADAAAIEKYHPTSILVPCPSLIQFNGVRVPPRASLWIDCRSFTRPEIGGAASAAPSHRVGPVRFALRVRDGEESAALLDVVIDAEDTNPWSEPEHRDVDLSRFAGRNVMIELETTGAAPAVDWGTPLLFAER